MNKALLDLTYFDFYQGLLTSFILALGLIVCSLLAKKKYDLKYIITLYIWHTFFSIFYWYYSLSNTADAIKYFRKSFTLVPNMQPGTRFTETLTFIITNTLESNYINTTLVSNIFGAIGLTLLYLSIKRYLFYLNKLWIVILFTPSMSFWSSGLGKDSISFMATCLFLYSITRSNTSWRLITIAFISMFMVRPHIAAMMLVSFVIYFIVKSKAHIILKFIILPVIAASLFLTLGFVQQYVGIEDTSLDAVSSYIDSRQSANLEGGSSLDIASMSYPMQMFTYIFRPLPFEAHNAVALITSFENTALLLIFLYVFLKSKSSFKTFFRNENLWLFMYAFLTCTMLALTTANLGIATRQKWMFMPVLIYLLIYAFHDYKTKKAKVYS